MRRFAACLLVILASACGQLPRPFQPEDKSGNALLHLVDRAGVLVRPITADAPGRPEAMAEVLAAALRARNLPATTRGRNQGSRILTGRAAVVRLPAGRDEVMLYWELRDMTGARLGSYAQRSELEPGAWQIGDPEAIAPVVDQAAGVIAAMVQGPPIESAAARQAHLVILPITGLPGDGGTSLPRALKAALAAVDLTVAEEAGAEGLLIACEVDLGPPRGGLQEIAVTWAVIRASDNAELGRIEQQNAVPAGSLDGPWGATARGIAQGAAFGILELVERLGETI